MCQSIGNARAGTADGIDILVTVVIVRRNSFWCGSGPREEVKAKTVAFINETFIDQISVAVVWFLHNS